MISPSTKNIAHDCFLIVNIAFLVPHSALTKLSTVGTIILGSSQVFYPCQIVPHVSGSRPAIHHREENI
jgi:hypothetical protein